MLFHLLCTFMVQLFNLTSAVLPENYVQLSSDEKLKILWTNVLAGRYDLANLPATQPQGDICEPVKNASFVAITFTHESDEFPAGRNRLISAFGSIAKVNLQIWPNSTYSGLFKTGGHGIARLSDQFQHSVGSFNPVMAIKIPVDGRPSVNLNVIHDPTVGQGDDLNFFATFLTNIPVPMKKLQPDGEPRRAPTGQYKAFLDGLASLPGGPDDRPESVLNLPVYELAAIHFNGTVVKDNVVTPFEVIFKPNPAVGWPGSDRTDFRVKLAQLPAGSLLYTVFVRRYNYSLIQEYIGNVLTESEFVASKYGDGTLFFKHTRLRWRPPTTADNAMPARSGTAAFECKSSFAASLTLLLIHSYLLAYI